MENSDYKQLIENARKLISGNEFWRDITLEPEDIVHEAILKVAEEGVETTLVNIQKYILLSLKEEQSAFNKVIPENITKSLDRLSTWKKNNPDKIEEYSKRHSKLLTARATEWNKYNAKKYKENQRNARRRKGYIFPGDDIDLMIKGLSIRWYSVIEAQQCIDNYRNSLNGTE